MGDEFQGKTALVTGASRGIGASTAIARARAGCKRVYVHYNSNAEGAERTAAEIRQAGAEAMVVAGNLSSEAGIRAFVDMLAGEPNAIDYLVNNAGSLVRRATLAEFNYALFDEVMNLNAKSMFFLTQAVAPRMAARGGAIVNLSSIAARTGGGSGAAVYAATPEAVFVSMVDNLDARMGMVERALRQANEADEFSERLPGLNTQLLTKKV